jgi:hypothetical protein
MEKILMPLAAVAVCVLLAGCAAPRPTVKVTAVFEEAATAAQLQEGENTIKGSALMRQQGGGVVTCAGFPVTVFPATPYARERMRALYESESGGINPVVGHRNPIFDPNPQAYADLKRETTCDAQGFFKVDKLKDGDFYVITPIAWLAGGARQGGMLSALVKLKGGEVKEVVLAR